MAYDQHWILDGSRKVYGFLYLKMYCLCLISLHILGAHTDYCISKCFADSYPTNPGLLIMNRCDIFATSPVSCHTRRLLVSKGTLPLFVETETPGQKRLSVLIAGEAVVYDDVLGLGFM